MPILVPRWELTLLGCWQLKQNDQPVDVGARQKRVITAIALLGIRPRHFIATLLWPDGSEAQAAGNLRASIFRISHELPFLMRTTEPLQLGNQVAVDVHQLRRMIGAVIDSGEPGVPSATIELLRTTELLPGWYEDWVVCEQELLQHERVDALEILARRYLARGDPSHAIVAARSAASIEPLRESLQLLLVRGHLAADNRPSALSAYRDFCVRLRRELGVAPSPRFAALLKSELAGTVRAT
ncbi:AfsR/SARP family transcriptional regulator [Cryobacterium psychrophilum]|uniref:Transcriptional regulator n=1 Tax=Cryobacterium psychrophilum TaxID=41988 RepID=A0A4Y8KV50_9MICO|nr:bacterial transcriptional activator domain-containing protein [Cryobacterium psychrophilum]TDW28666.1 DNA-binding SARP family transcriptional activator [Cryobacterium psychrophilum]TFD82327.1 transcriptional regulator [Cryobacterium psychrophilum]